MKKATLGGVVLAVVLAAGAAYWVTRGKAGGTAQGDGNAATAAPTAASSGAAGSGGGSISVTTVRAQKKNVDVVLETTGTVAALNTVDVRSQVSSIITKVNIREGQFVKAGELLFTLDSRNDEVNLAKAKAQLAKDEAALADAQRQLQRSKDLMAQNFISQAAVDTNQTLVDSQKSVVAASRAAIDAAQVALSYNRIVAPAAGRAGAINVYPGTTVQPGGAVLVTITQLDPIAVAFNLPQRNLNDALQTLRSGGGKVNAVLPEQLGKKGSTIVGKLQFVDNVVDPNSGTVRVKAQFDNANDTLWPGAFVNVQLAVRTLADATVVPQAAVIQGPRGNIVYVIDAQNKAQARPVEVVYAAGLDAVVNGVQPGEKVVVDGRQNLRSGAPVSERAASAASNGASGAASGATRGAAATDAAAGNGLTVTGATVAVR
ncbi:MAG TPA: efflux RND transporter periplasmic adaptor subunit [Burkholderiaceae bacterium]|nr:efflux RND transporter periplasmic adaptor subunit [Burkholderiaceae bacterium]